MPLTGNELNFMIMHNQGGSLLLDIIYWHCVQWFLFSKLLLSPPCYANCNGCWLLIWYIEPDNVLPFWADFYESLVCRTCTLLHGNTMNRHSQCNVEHEYDLENFYEATLTN